MAKEEQSSQVCVLMVPFPAQGHLNQLLHLSRLLISSNKNIQIHYASTPSHCRQAKLRFHGWNLLSTTSSNLHFHQLSIPPFNSPPPNPDSTIMFPSHLQPSIDAFEHLREPVAKLMKSLSSISQRVVVINDSLMGSVIQDFVSLPNAESYSFRSLSAFFIMFFEWERMGRPFPIEEQILDILPSMDDCFTPEFHEFLNTQSNYFKLSTGDIYNSCGILEGRFLELLEKNLSDDTNKKHWALGPFNPVKITNIDEYGIRHKCLEWLDKQIDNSVLYVSFGSSTSMSDEQIKQLAIGLEKSKQKFLWVLRDADKGDVFDGEARTIQLPDGFEESVQEQGFVLRSWAPQLAILGHPATGGFMSHCGWNSCMESITMGVPIAAWPMHSDQPRNAALIAHVLKIGLVVRDWGSRNQLVTSSMVEEAVRKLMVSEVGGEVRKRAAELVLSGVQWKKMVLLGGNWTFSLLIFVDRSHNK